MRPLWGFLLATTLAACSGERLSTAQYSDGTWVQDTRDPGEKAVKEEVLSLPFKDVVWEFPLTRKQITRMTLAGDHLFLETPDYQVIAMDRFNGEIKWIYRIDTQTPLDWPPVVAEGVPEQLRKLEAELVDMRRKVDDSFKEKGDGPETKKVQKQRDEVREKLRAEASGDNVFFISQQVLYCLDRKSGGFRWTHRLNFIPSARPYAIRNYVFVPGADLPRVWACDVEKKGAEVAFYKTTLQSTENFISNRPIYSDPSLYFVSHDGNIYCYKVTDGTLTWKYPTERELRADPVVFFHKEVTKDGDRTREQSWRILFVGGTDLAFYAIDGDGGGIIWKYECGADIRTPAVAKDKTVYVRTEGGALHAFEVMPFHTDAKTGAPVSQAYKRNGRLRWKLPMGERFIVKGKERIYVMGPGSEIYAMDEMSGAILGRTKTNLLQHIITNTADDFLYVANAGGYVYCLREPKD